MSTATQATFDYRSPMQKNGIYDPNALVPNQRIKMDGIKFLKLLDASSAKAAFFDPQYRGVLDKLAYGNEGKLRGKRRCALSQMDEKIIVQFIQGIDRALVPSGHLFLWVDKFHLCQGIRSWLKETDFGIVDLINWDKKRMGMGYRSRRVTEYCIVLQKHPHRAKGVWKIHNIPDTWSEKVDTKRHPHTKPIELQSQLICAVSDKGDCIIDPAAGSFSVMTAARRNSRNFLGCDLEG